MKPPPWLRSPIVLLAIATLAWGAVDGCTRSRASGARPNLAGTWDVTYDDVIEVEIHIAGEVHRARVPAEGGLVAFHDAGQLLEVNIECARPELVCPSEVWPSELSLDNRMGDVDDDGDQLAVSFVGEGTGNCRLKSGSLASAEIDATGVPMASNWEAASLTGGQATSVVSLSCVGRVASELPAEAEVRLSTGFTASRR